MARYTAEYGDVAPLIRRQLTRGLLLAGAVWVAAVGAGALLQISESMSAMTFGMGIAVALACQAFVDYWRARSLWAEPKSVDLQMAEDGIEVSTELRRTFIRRSREVLVVEHPGVFFVDAGRTPLAIPTRHLDAAEQGFLRAWAVESRGVERTEAR